MFFQCLLFTLFSELCSEHWIFALRVGLLLLPQMNVEIIQQQVLFSYSEILKFKQFKSGYPFLHILTISLTVKV